jgi:LPS-assembly protein
MTGPIPWRRIAAALAIALTALVVAAPPSAAQDAPPETATLIADRVAIRADSALVAEGGVEVLYRGSRLTAARITYDQRDGRLVIEGPITLTQGDDIVVLADAAELDADLQNGILTSARLVLNRELQVAAAALSRVDGRYALLSNTVASSCRVCANSQTPLWQIRARQVVHDTETRQIYFTGARLEVVGVPIAYVPRLRLPDPTLRRSRGFLVPDLTQSNLLGFGFRAPYFIPLGPSADVTLAPFLTTKSRTVELRYRQEFRSGGIEANGAVSQDDLTDDPLRGYLFLEGAFDLPRDFRLAFDAELVSDVSYLSDYGYSNADRLDSEVALSRIRRDERLSASLVAYRTLRASEQAESDQLPSPQGLGLWELRLFPAEIGGEARLRFSAQAYRRESEEDVLGRDQIRIGSAAQWRGERVLPGGIVAGAEGEFALDLYRIGDDASFPETEVLGTPTLAADLRWPLARRGAAGSDMLTPMVQLVWTDRFGPRLPNEDSVLPEFDEGNLFALTRFPGEDQRERGARLNLGVTWTHLSARDWEGTVTLGRILRDEDLGQFGGVSGLSGLASDWLVAGQLRLGERIALTGRALFDDALDVSRAEGRVDWTDRRLTAVASYVWSEADPAASRPEAASELRLDTGLTLTPQWILESDLRYDFVADSAADARVGVMFRNECIAADLSLSRRLTSSTTVRPSTDIGLRVTLLGFGGERAGPRGTVCGG